MLDWLNIFGFFGGSLYELILAVVISVLNLVFYFL